MTSHMTVGCADIIILNENYNLHPRLFYVTDRFLYEDPTGEWVEDLLITYVYGASDLMEIYEWSDGYRKPMFVPSSVGDPEDWPFPESDMWPLPSEDIL